MQIFDPRQRGRYRKIGDTMIALAAALMVLAFGVSLRDAGVFPPVAAAESSADIDCAMLKPDDHAMIRSGDPAYRQLLGRDGVACARLRTH